MTRTVAESDNYDVTINLLVVREFGAVGAIMLSYEVVARGIPLNTAKGRSLSTDIYPNRGVLNFTSGVASKNIELRLKRDEEPEIAEHYEVRSVLYLFPVYTLHCCPGRGPNTTRGAPRPGSDEGCPHFFWYYLKYWVSFQIVQMKKF